MSGAAAQRRQWSAARLSRLARTFSSTRTQPTVNAAARSEALVRFLQVYRWRLRQLLNYVALAGR
jgi:hypothetical protein